MIAVIAENLTMHFGKNELWHDLSFKLAYGSMVALTGPSGSGKSTLLDCIAGFIEPSSGQITLDERFSPHSRRHQRRVRAEHVGFLFQDYALVEDSTVEENLQLGVRTSIFTKKASKKQLQEVLAKVALDMPLNTKVATLSGGERQRVAVARLLLKPKPLILADEPTGALDQRNADIILGYLRQFAETGSCVVVATHDAHAVEMCDGIVTLDTPTRAHS